MIDATSILQPMSPVTSEDERQGDEHYEVDGIVDHHFHEEVVQYLVHWKGYESKYDTWEYESQFDDLGCIKKYWKEQRQHEVETADKAYERIQRIKKTERYHSTV